MSTGTANPENDRLFFSLMQDGVFSINFKTGVVRHNSTGHLYDKGPAGYISVEKKVDGKKESILAHRLVWMAYNGKLIKEGYEINHLDGDKRNNRPFNLKQATPSKNRQHAFNTGLIDADVISRAMRGINMGHRHATARFTRKGAAKVRRLYRRGFTQRKLANMYDVCKTTIQFIVTDRSYKF